MFNVADVLLVWHINSEDHMSGDAATKLEMQSWMDYVTQRGTTKTKYFNAKRLYEEH